MADLTPLQTISQWVGLIGGALGILNTVQSWRKNRPRVSVEPDRHGPVLRVTIENPSSRSITITRTWCLWPREVYGFYVDDRGYPKRHAQYDQHDVHVVIEAKARVPFTFIQGSEGYSGFLLLVRWHSNSTFIVSLVPLVIFRTKGQVERLIKKTRQRE